MFSFLIFPHLQNPFNLNPDPDRNGELGENISKGIGYVYNGETTPAIDRGPVYPYLLAGIFSLSGGFSLHAVQIVQALLFGLTCFVVFQIASTVSGEKTAFITALICALHPLLIWYTARIWIETTNTLLIALGTYSAILLYKKRTILRALICGCMLGLAILTKSVLLIFPLVLAIVLLWKSRMQSLGAVAVLLLTVVIVVAPWTYRNYKVSGAFVPVHVSLGLNLIQGDALALHWTSQPLSSLQLWFKGKERMDFLLAGTSYTPTDADGDRFLTYASFQYNLTHPIFFLKRAVLNFFTFWYLGESPLKSVFLILMQIPLMILTIVASIRLWKFNELFQPVILVIAYYAILHSMIIGWARYSVPIVPLCVVLSVMFLLEKRKTILT